MTRVLFFFVTLWAAQLTTAAAGAVRLHVALPANAPPGNYQVTVYRWGDGQDLPHVVQQVNVGMQMFECSVDPGGVSRRAGPVSWRCDWWTNEDAQSTIGDAKGGGHDLVLELPHLTVEHYTDLFGDLYILMAHEILHSLGYVHSAEMFHLQDIGCERLSQLRWQAVDSGVWPIWTE